MAEKVTLVNKHGAEFGINRSLAALNLSKGTWHYHTNKKDYGEKYSYLKATLLDIAEEHPEYGYRRSTTELNDLGYPVNKKVVQSLQKHWNLSVARCLKPPPQSPFRNVLYGNKGKLNLVERIESVEVFQVLYTDFTELVYGSGQFKAQLIPFLDDNSRTVLGWALGNSADTSLVLEAWQMSKASIKRFGKKFEGVIIHQDMDPVFTSNIWAAQILIKDKAKLSFSENGAKGNTKMESFNSRFKSENHSLFYDCADMEELRKRVADRIRYYNVMRRHSSLENISPMNYLNNQGINFRRKS